MSQTIRVSLPGYNALTDTNLDHYALYADSDNVLIKEKARGSGTINNGATVNIAHGLSYIPFFLLYTESQVARDDGGNLITAWAIVGQPNISAEFYAYANTTNIVLTNGSGATAEYKYYIFYDQMI